MAPERENPPEEGPPIPPSHSDAATRSCDPIADPPTRIWTPDSDKNGSVLQPGAVLGKYTIQACLSAGAFGTVYAARHRVLGRTVAIKVLHHQWATSPMMVQRFLGEAQAVNRIRHPSIVDIFEFEMLEDGVPYLIMELLQGHSLKELVTERGTLSPHESLDLLTPVCDALDAAHKVGIIHRDIKGSNILVALPGLPWKVKLIDFGIAKLMATDAPGLTQTGARLGTPTAMAPEQVLGRPVDSRTDVYGLGVLLFSMLCGRYPFESSNLLEVERMHLSAPVPRVSKFAPVGSALDRVVIRSMEKHAEDRFASVDDFRLALEAAVKEQTGTGSSPRAPSRDGRQHDSGETLTAMALCIYVALLIAGDDLEDEVLDDLDQILDTVEEEFAARTFSVPVRTGTSMLGCMVLKGTPEEQLTRRADLIHFAQNLAARLAGREGAAMHVNVSVHLGPVRVRDGSAGIVVGAITRPSEWAPAEAVQGVWLSQDAALGMTLPAREGHGGLVISS